MFAAIALILLAVTPARSAPPLCSSVPSLTAVGIPDDACNPRQLPEFAHMAWQVFKMLVWPAHPTMRGMPDNTRNLTDIATSRVFETYKGDWETFLKDAAEPLDWNKTPATTENICSNDPPLQISPGTLVLASLNEFGNVVEPAFKDIVHVLVAQNGSLVRYLAAFDENQFKLIQAKKLYNQSNVPPSDETDPPPPPPHATAPDGSITIKSAWIEMGGLTSDPALFHTRKALLQDPKTRKCEEALVGLVGLHIVHKTKSSPQWIWSSFEHVMNAPLRGAPLTAGATFTFNDGSGTPMPSFPPSNSQDPMGPGWTVPPPYNVERLAPIAGHIVPVNTAWRATLALAGSVWANYELVTVQWPGVPGDPGRDALNAKPTPPCMGSTGTLGPTNLANTTMETFAQYGLLTHDACTNGMTCMGCHNAARPTDFVWAIPLNANTPPSIVTKNRETGLDFLKRITRWGNR